MLCSLFFVFFLLVLFGLRFLSWLVTVWFVLAVIVFLGVPAPLEAATKECVDDMSD